MKLDVRAVTIVAAVVWGVAIFVTGIGNLVSPPYGQDFLQSMASIYPGYHATASFGQVVVGTLYGVVDAAIVGFVVAWLYNRLARD